MNRPLRLLVAVQAFYPTYSGAAMRYRRYAPGLAERGVEMSVFTGTPWSGDEQLSPDLAAQWATTRVGRFTPPERHGGIDVCRVKLPPRYGRLRRVDVYNASLVRHCLSVRPDVVQLTSITRRIVPFVLALRAARIPTLASWTMMSDRDPRSLSRPLRALWRIQFDAADGVVVNSQTMGDALVGAGTRPPVTVIPNGVDTDRFHPVSEAQKRAQRAALDLPVTGPLIVTTGTVSPRKDHLSMVRAFAQVRAKHPDAHLVIAGPRRDRSQADLSDYAAKLDAAVQAAGPDNIHFVGLVSDVPAWLRAADAFWFTSKQEGLPNAILEAQASGLPVVAAEYVGMTPEMGSSGEHLLITDRSIDAMGDAMSEVLGDHQRARRLGRAARAWIESEHALSVAIDRYAALYQSMAR